MSFAPFIINQGQFAVIYYAPCINVPFNSSESSRHIIHENHGRFFRLAHSEKFAQGMRYPFPESDGIRHIFLFFDGFRKSRHCFDRLLQGTPASDTLRRCKTSRRSGKMRIYPVPSRFCNWEFVRSSRLADALRAVFIPFTT